ncbi:hypothetical protein [Candidatus Mycolicibacterium alkanivorans]|nr:hypothetical protein [Candidatus Mycolicibacterium alkanivorans]
MLRTIVHEFVRARAARKRAVRTPVQQHAARTDHGVHVAHGLRLI